MIPEDIWIAHLGHVPSDYLFPRKIGNPRQVLVNTKEAYLKGIKRLWDRCDLYVGLFSEPQKDLQLFHTVFIDFDAHDGDTYFTDLEAECYELYYWYKRKWKGTPRMVRSGRGYHLYLDFPLHFFESYRRGIVNFYKYIEDHFNFNFFDRRVYNMNKIVRLPHTVNKKADTMAVWTNPYEHEPSFKFGEYIDQLSTHPLPKIPDDGEHAQIDPLSDLALMLEIAPQVIDGRRVLLWQMIIPRLRLLNSSYDFTLQWCMNWISQTGQDPAHYRTYIASQYNVPTFPYKWNTFFYYNPELNYLKAIIQQQHL